MLKHMIGSIFDSKAEALINPVNCVGVMGKGLALEFKRRFPGNFELYEAECKHGPMFIGKMLLFEYENGQTIINFPTKKHWKDNSKLEWIETGLRALAKKVELYDIRSVAMPLLGCGLGGLDEKEVIPLIEEFANKLPHVEVELWRM